jgi:hypothetical protein
LAISDHGAQQWGWSCEDNSCPLPVTIFINLLKIHMAKMYSTKKMSSNFYLYVLRAQQEHA